MTESTVTARSCVQTGYIQWSDGLGYFNNYEAEAISNDATCGTGCRGQFTVDTCQTGPQSVTCTVRQKLVDLHSEPAKIDNRLYLCSRTARHRTLTLASRRPLVPAGLALSARIAWLK